MKRQPVAPTGVAQDLRLEEAFFSTTDARGVIQSGNETFVRVSGYSETELVGAAHNIIRHPHMPRCVFGELWAALQRGEVFKGYVKNQAKNGNHYWVFALVEPLETARLSIRFKPSLSSLETIESVYSQALEREEQLISEGEPLPGVLAGGWKVIEDAVMELGYESYCSFSEAAFREELSNRDRELERLGRAEVERPQRLEFRCEKDRARYGGGWAAYAILRDLFRELDAFLAVAREIEEQRDVVKNLASQFRMYSLNANLASQNLGVLTGSIQVITHFLHSQSEGLAVRANRFAADVSASNRSIVRLSSRIASARLQAQMLLVFWAERARGAQESGTARGRTACLKEALENSLADSQSCLEEIRLQVRSLRQDKEELRKISLSFRVAQINGLTESARSAEASHLSELFEGFRSKLAFAQTEIGRLDRVIEGIDRIVTRVPQELEKVSRFVSRRSLTPRSLA